MKYGFARCHDCDQEFEPEEPGDVLCPACQRLEDAQYEAVAFLEPEDERPWQYSRVAMQERLGVIGKVDE